MPSSILDFWELLTPEDKAYILTAVQQFSSEYKHLSMGALPFVPYRKIKYAIRRMGPGPVHMPIQVGNRMYWSRRKRLLEIISYANLTPKQRRKLNKHARADAG